jgi:hypothetical protein
MSNRLDGLRTAIRNEALPLAERKQAAEHLITALVDELQEPAEDDKAVFATVAPPSADGPLGDIYPRAWRIANEKRGWAASGPTLAQGRRHVHEQRRTELLKAIYTDKARHSLERIEAAQRILNSEPPLSFWRKNGYTAQRLVAEAS